MLLNLIYSQPFKLLSELSNRLGKVRLLSFSVGIE